MIENEMMLASTITGIIWKVEALPTPVAAKRNRNEAKKTGKALGFPFMPMA